VRNNFTKKIPETDKQTGNNQSNIVHVRCHHRRDYQVKDVGREYRIGDKKVEIVCCANDTVIISKDEDKHRIDNKKV